MSAAPQTAPGNERAPQPPAQEKPRGDFGEGGLEAREREAFEGGREKLGELGRNLNLQAETGAKEFGAQTKSWWDRAKGVFRKKKEEPVKGEDEIMKEVEKADAVYAAFKAKYDEIMASGDEAGLRSLERGLSQAYEQLAPQVAAEGASESRAMRKALKTGEMPGATETGAKLNDVTRRLQEVRGRLGGAPAPAPKAEAPAPAAPEAPAPSANRAEKELDEAFARGIAEFEAERAAAVAGAPEKPEAPADPEAAERAELMRKHAGKPGEKMVDEYLRMRKMTSDANGEIVRTTLNETTGEIRVDYADGSEYRKYVSGMALRVRPGGKVEEIKPQAQIVEEHEAEEEPFTEAEKAELAEGASRPEGAEDRERLLEDARAKAESLLQALDPRFSVSVQDLQVTPDDPSRAPYGVRALRVAHPEDPKMNWTMEVAEEEPSAALARLETAIRKVYDEKIAARGSVASGEIEAKEMPVPAAEEEPSVVLAPEIRPMKVVRSSETPAVSGEIETPAVLQSKKTSEDALTASGEIEVADADIIESVPEISVEPGPDLEMTPAPEAKPEAAPAAEQAPVAAEKKEFPMDRLGSVTAEVAEKRALPLAKETGSPKTYATKIEKMPAAEFLKLYTDEGRLSAEDAAALAEEFKTDSEGFNRARKRLADAVKKLTRP